jgi:hypothetical protein
MILCNYTFLAHVTGAWNILVFVRYQFFLVELDDKLLSCRSKRSSVQTHRGQAFINYWDRPTLFPRLWTEYSYNDVDMLCICIMCLSYKANKNIREMGGSTRLIFEHIWKVIIFGIGGGGGASLTYSSANLNFYMAVIERGGTHFDLPNPSIRTVPGVDLISRNEYQEPSLSKVRPAHKWEQLLTVHCVTCFARDLFL